MPQRNKTPKQNPSQIEHLKATPNSDRLICTQTLCSKRLIYPLSKGIYTSHSLPLASSSAGVKRYPPWLQKALRVKEQSERFWTQQQRRQEASDTRQEPPQQELSPATQPLPAGHSSVWDAIAAHDAGFVKEFIESEPQRLFCRWEGISVGGGGVTLLHKAVAHGALEIVALLLRVLQSRFPSETCRKFINKHKDLKKAALERVQQALCREKESAARRQAADNFRAKTPAYPRESDTPPEKLLRAALRIQTS